MKYKTIVIVAGGDLSLTLIPNIKKGHYIIGADYGAYWLLAHGVTPNEAVGDFDSVSKEQMQLITECVPLVRIYPKEKDYTDLELALQMAVKLKPQEINMYGVTGGRIDHTLAAIYLLEQYHNLSTKIVCIDEQNEIQLVTKALFVSKGKQYKYYSLLPITNTVQLSLKGFSYPLHNAVIHRGKTIGISNELQLSKGVITVYKGKLLCVMSRDKNI